MTKVDRVLLWLPVALLPAANLLAAAACGVAYGAAEVVPWVVGAVVEELAFRRVLLVEGLLPRMVPARAVLLSSALFAVAHLFNRGSADALLLQAACALCFSVWAGAAAWRSTWLVPLLAHALTNATAVADAPLAGALASLAALACGALLLRGDARGGV